MMPTTSAAPSPAAPIRETVRVELGDRSYDILIGTGVTLGTASVLTKIIVFLTQ